METARTTAIAADVTSVAPAGVSALDWASVTAGAIVTAALVILLMTFGSAVGLSVASPWSASTPTASTVSIIAAAWFLFVCIASYLIGGYVAGRLRARRGDATEHEARIRDGLHGVAVWGLGVLISVVFAAGTAASLGAGAAKVGGAVAQAGAQVAAGAASRFDPAPYLTDVLFRREQPGGGEAVPPAREEAQRVLLRIVATGEVSDADRSYLTRQVSASAGIDPAQAEQRVTQVTTEAKRLADEAKNKALQAADTARKGLAIGGFLTTTAFLLALAFAWLGATLGGEHRDAGTVFRALRPRVSTIPG